MPPPLESSFRTLDFYNELINWETHSKGKLGRVGIVGGCQKYSGACYFAALSASLAFAELTYVYCENATQLKAMLPNSIVTDIKYFRDKNIFESPIIDTFLVGCGLGQEEFSDHVMNLILNWNIDPTEERSCIYDFEIPAIKKLPKKCIILDADALQHKLTSAVIDWAHKSRVRLIMTCNNKEYAIISNLLETKLHSDGMTFLDRLPNNFIVMQKGFIDQIYFGNQILKIEHYTSISRHPGGLGDILAGLTSGLCASTLFVTDLDCVTQ